MNSIIWAFILALTIGFAVGQPADSVAEPTQAPIDTPVVTPTSNASCAPPLPLEGFECHGNKWVYPATLYVPQGATLLAATDIVINGNLVMHSEATLSFNVLYLVSINGSAILDGTLDMFSDSLEPGDPDVFATGGFFPIAVLSADGVSGEFHTFHVERLSDCIAYEHSRSRFHRDRYWYEVNIKRACFSGFEISLVAVSAVCGVFWLGMIIWYVMVRIRNRANPPPPPPTEGGGSA